ncbi:MAG: hypothetical protein ACD_12C00408G0001 [uncultured bacterium]|nr:MAG: hypothetical protein ACD_12C00408G0001 [uncultured bacterium]HLC87925.1 DUF192 domain-containing protein [Patescibacteria group bacterium]
MDKKFWFQLFGLVAVILLATFLAFNRKYLIPLTSQLMKPTGQGIQDQSKQTLKIQDSQGNLKAQINLELADTPDKRSKGLGYRDSLSSGSGMLFIHDKTQKYVYWMKGMKFPIDFIWILDDQIVDIKPDVPPPIAGQTDDTLERYGSVLPVNKVLETNAGFVEANNIQKGDKIIVENKSK